MVKLTVLGSGTMVLTKKRFSSAFLLDSGKTKILIDCGMGAIARLVENDIKLGCLDAVFISHFHSDHFADLFPLVQSRAVEKLYTGKEYGKLKIIGPSPIEKHFHTWRSIFWPEPKESYPLEFMEGEGEYTIGDVALSTFPVQHVQWFNSIGAKFKIGNKVIAYPGDIGGGQSIEFLAEKYKNADLLIIEAGYPEIKPNHISLEYTKELVHLAGIKKTLIVHVKPTAEAENTIKEFIKDNPSFVLAEDGQEINF